MTTFHLKQSIAGCLRNNPVGTIDFLEDANGKPLSDAEARIELNKLLAMGHTVMPVGNQCEGFDVFGGGCAGHEPLEGSDLVRAMLERGDKFVMCHVGANKNITVIAGWNGNGFTSVTNPHSLYLSPKPINNQGELLSAREVGL